MTTGTQPYLPISDYGLIGDSRACALVSRDGSIDWLCLPRPDSPPVFGRLLDWQTGGYFQIAPLASFETRRRYLPSTNVLETTFTTGDGTVVLTDLMPALTESAKSRALHPLRAVIRTVECTAGEVPMTLRFEPTSGYEKRPATFRAKDARMVMAGSRNHVLVLRGDVPLSVGAAGAAAEFRARPGEVVTFCLTYSEGEPAVFPGDDYASRVKAETITFWQDWCRSFSYQGDWADVVLRSALTLKLLSYAPSGAVLAAPTTSLPEDIGGERNWDYRYCWPRDAAFSVKALYSLGFVEEAEAFFAWLLHATRLKRSRLQPLYTLFGIPHVGERTLDGWDGYMSSRPVRVGNAAANQTQLDVYGELVDAAHAFLVRQDGSHSISSDEAEFLKALVDLVAASWREPDSGIWEPRVAPRHYTHSKVMAWVALTRGVDLQKRGLIGGPAERWQREADAVHAAVLARGYDVKERSFTQTFDGRNLDAALLVLPLVDFLPPVDERIRTTVAAVRAGLDTNGFLNRYVNFDDGLVGEEGAFLICNFWLAAALARLGELTEAKAVFERTLDSANDLQLLPEEYDSATGTSIGNFPQAFSHLGLIMAALEIAAAEP